MISGLLDAADQEDEDTPATDVKVQYVWSARYIDSPVLRDRDADSDTETGDLGKSGSGLEERLYYQTDAGDGSTWDLDQGRTHNLVNEITDITEQADPQQEQRAAPIGTRELPRRCRGAVAHGLPK